MSRYICTGDVRASDIGMDSGLGLIYPKGAHVSDLLPEVEKLLLLQKKIVPESELQQQQAKQASKQLFRIKRGRGAPENKGR